MGVLSIGGKKNFKFDTHIVVDKVDFTENKELELNSNKNDSSYNLLLEGDNLYSLHFLMKEYENRIHVIYIDPPYNRGKNDFVYTDNFLTNGNKHLKWLEFMNSRLILAKRLLKDDGVILISIDENELFHLKLLCDDIFDEENFIANFIWQNKYSPSNDKKGITSVTEYILCYAKDKTKVTYNNLPLRDDYIKNTYKNPDNDPRGPWRSCSLYRAKNPISYEIVSPTGKVWNKPWNYSKENMAKLIDDNRIYWGKDGNGVPSKKVFLFESVGRKPTNLILGKDVCFSLNGSEELKEIFGNREIFQHPKPVKLMKFLLQIFVKKDSIILDFFAGSGTTGQAVLELNRDDNGKRKFILCQNNENNICMSVTYERLKRIIKGYTNMKNGKFVAGIPANLKYFKQT